MEGSRTKKHIILVHGSCHGAWCWYKLATLLRSAGHQVTVPDLSASGIDTKKFEEVSSTFSDYSHPLMEIMGSLPSHEKVILVGHSFGGLSLALAMDTLPEKITVAVFVTAFMPDSSSRPSYVLDQYVQRTPRTNWLDTQFSFDRGPEKPLTSMLFGPMFLSTKLYQLFPPEDFMLATTLVRVGSLFQEDLSIAHAFSKTRYGSVDIIYIKCRQDLAISEDFQCWMIENYPVKEVKEIDGADHMPMLSKPRELCQCLLDIADTYT